VLVSFSLPSVQYTNRSLRYARRGREKGVAIELEGLHCSFSPQLALLFARDWTGEVITSSALSTSSVHLG
jgi:hypothetical protein